MMKRDAYKRITGGRQQLAMRYVKAHLNWARRGFKMRRPREIARIYDEHCSKCEWFCNETRTCRVCGCSLNRARRLFINKIALQTEHCPRKKW